MKIGMFTDTWEIDGVSNSIRRARQGLENRGHEVFVFAPSATERGWCGRDYFLKGYRFPLYKNYILSFMPEDLTRVVPDLDVIHVHTPAFVGIKGCVVASKLGLPSVFTYHTDFVMALESYITTIPPRLISYLGKLYLNGFLKSFRGIIFPSNYTRACSGWINAPAKQFVFSTGVGEDFRPVSVTRDPRMVLTVGRVAQEKNLELIFKAMEHLPEHRLVVAGSGPMLEYYRSKHESVEFLGFVEHERLLELYSSAGCFVMASKFDTQGMVVQEAMACGTPVAVLNHGAMPEFVTKNAGRLFPENPKEAALVIEEVCRTDFDVGVDNTVERFARSLEDVYKSI